jgi:hypothetical protein
VILFLLKEGVARDALRRLSGRAGAQKAVVNGQCFGFIFWVDQQIEKQPVINGGAVRLLHPRVQIAQRLRRFLVLRRLIEHRQIGFDCILDAVLFEESLCAVQMLADVCGHLLGLPLRCLPAD